MFSESKLLLDESPLIIQRTLAKRIGLNESIILQQIHYQLYEVSKRKLEAHFKDGEYWIWKTHDDWKSEFDWWSLSTIRRTLDVLEKDGLVVTGSFNRMPMDKTKWYRIDYQVVNEKLREPEKPKPSVQNEQIDLLKMSSPCVQNEQMQYTVVSAVSIAETQQNRSAQNEQIDLLKMSSPCVQNEQSTSVQNEQSNNIRIRKNIDPLSVPEEHDVLPPPVEKRKQRERALPQNYPAMFEAWWKKYSNFCGVVKPTIRNPAGSRADAARAFDEMFDSGTCPSIELFMEGTEEYVRIKLEEFARKQTVYGVAHGVNYIKNPDPKNNQYKWKAAYEFKYRHTGGKPKVLPWRLESGEWNEEVLSFVASHLAKKFNRPADRIQAIEYICGNEQPGAKYHEALIELCKNMPQKQNSTPGDARSDLDRLPAPTRDLFREFIELQRKHNNKVIRYAGKNSQGIDMYWDGDSSRVQFTESSLRFSLKLLKEKELEVRAS